MCWSPPAGHISFGSAAQRTTTVLWVRLQNLSAKDGFSDGTLSKNVKTSSGERPSVFDSTAGPGHQLHSFDLGLI